jgi:N-acetyl-anhydromuramyl-L-alanine amidase AmpD
VQKYGEWSGETHSWRELEEAGHAVDVRTGKWGVEYRVYFVKDAAVKKQMERYGYRVEDGDVRRPDTYRINNEGLFKELVQNHGLRLGENM